MSSRRGFGIGLALGLALAGRLAAELGVIVTPGETFGPAGAGHVRLAAVQPDDRIELVAARAMRT